MKIQQLHECSWIIFTEYEEKNSHKYLKKKHILGLFWTQKSIDG